MRVAALLLITLAATACAQTPPSTQPTAGVLTCHADPVSGVLPDWAREGFSSAQPSMLYEIGRSGQIAALIFGHPLSSPPATDHTNKVLWVARHPSAAARLDISAQRMNGTATVGGAVTESVVGGPGPSIVNVPAPGCWRLTLTWADQTDTLDLEYIGGAG